MLISVIVPVQNGENVIERCVKSIQEQTYKNLEIIIVENGSKDNTLTVCQQLADKDKRIHVIHTEQSGVSNARNLGLRYAHGEYVTFVDADDYIDENMYETMLNNIIQHHVDGCICSFAEHFYKNIEVKKLPWKQHEILDSKKLKQEYVPYLLGRKKGDPVEVPIMGSVWRILFSYDLVKDIFFDAEIQICEDVLFCMTIFLSKECKVVVEQMAFYHYLRTEASAMTGYRKDYFERTMIYQNKIEELVKKFDEKQIITSPQYAYVQFSSYTTAFSNICRKSNAINIWARRRKIYKLVLHYEKNTIVKKYLDVTELSIGRKVTKALMDAKCYWLLTISFTLKEFIRVKNAGNLYSVVNRKKG